MKRKSAPVDSHTKEVAERVCVYDQVKLLRRKLLLLDETATTVESLVKLYENLYRIHYGTVSAYRGTSKEQAVFERLLQLCTTFGVSPVVYIRSQFDSMQPFLESNNELFNVMMLSGDKALSRYNNFIKLTVRRYNDCYAYPTNIPFIRILNDVSLCEANIGTTQLRNVIAGTPISRELAEYRNSTSTDWMNLVRNESGIPKMMKMMAVGHGQFIREYIYLRAVEIAVSNIQALLGRYIHVCFANHSVWGDLCLMLRNIYVCEGRQDFCELDSAEFWKVQNGAS